MTSLIDEHAVRHLRVLAPSGCLSFHILLCIIVPDELLFYMRLLSPSIMFLSFGEDIFLTMVVLH